MLHYPHTNSRCCAHVHLLPCGEVGSSDSSPGRQQPSPGHSELPQLALRRCPCLGKVAPQWSRHLRAHRHTTTPSELYNGWSWCVCVCVCARTYPMFLVLVHGAHLEGVVALFGPCPQIDHLVVDNLQ